MSRAIVYAYTGARWSDFPGRQFQLTRALARHVRVVYLESGVRSDRRRLRPWAEETPDGVTVIRNAMRLRYGRGGRRVGLLASAIDGLMLRSVMSAIGVDQYVYWVSSADPRLLGGMALDRLVYDCIDPCFVDEYRTEAERQERAIASRAKLLFATAESLAERMRGVNPDVYLIPNGSPCGTPPPPSEPGTGRPGKLGGTTGAVVGYLGTLDWRFDVPAVRAAAAAMPDVTFCLAGRVNASVTADVDELRKLPNVIVTGPVSTGEGAKYMAAFDVGFIPFRTGEMNDAVNPCKMYMHLWYGSPVVATDIRECRRHHPWVTVAREYGELPGLIRNAIAAASTGREARQQFAVENNWDARARQAMDALQTHGLLGTMGGEIH